MGCWKRSREVRCKEASESRQLYVRRLPAVVEGGSELPVEEREVPAPPPPPPSAQERPAVVLLHGMLGSHRYMLPIQKELAAAGFETLAVDLLGFGSSPQDGQSFDTEAHVEALRSVTSALGRRYLAVGHSLGALLAQELLVRDEACVGCVCLATPAFRSMQSFYSHTRRSSLMSWALMVSPRWLTWPLCQAFCQQRWFWRPLALRLLTPLLEGLWGWGADVVDGFFDHSHDSCYHTMHDCLVPLLLSSVDAKALRGRAIFLHGSEDDMAPLAGLLRKLGKSGADAVRVLDGESHFSVVKRTREVLSACSRLARAAAARGGTRAHTSDRMRLTEG